MDILMIKETYMDQNYELASLDFGANGIIIDIGAGVGDFSI